MVHRSSVPAAARRADERFVDQLLAVLGGSELHDLQGDDAVAVGGFAVLREAVELAVDEQRAAGGAGDVGIAGHDGAAGVLGVGAGQFVGVVEARGAVARGDEEPPAVVVMEERGIDELLAFQELGLERPLVGEARRAVEAHDVVGGLGHHVVRALPLEREGIREHGGAAQDESAGNPFEAVGALGEADAAFASLDIFRGEERIVPRAFDGEERMRHGVDIGVAEIGGDDDGIGGTGRGFELEGRWPGVEANGPDRRRRFGLRGRSRRGLGGGSQDGESEGKERKKGAHGVRRGCGGTLNIERRTLNVEVGSEPV